MDKLLNIDELAALLRVKKSFVYEKSRLGQIPCLKIGKYLRFDPEEVQKWLGEKKRGRQEMIS